MRIITFLFIFALTALSGFTTPPGIRSRVVQTLRVSILREAAWAMQQAPVTVTASRNPRSAGGLHDFSSDVLVNLTAHYRAAPGSNKGFLLLDSTGSKPANSEVDVPLNYADYYYLQALLRSRSFKAN